MDFEADQRFCRNLLRVVGMVLVWSALLVLVANLVETWGTVSLAYWKSYLRSEIARPLIFVAGGGFLWFSAGWWARRIVR